LTGTVSITVVNEAGNPLDVTSVNEIHAYPYSAWQSLPPTELWLVGGSGSGGAGGDGQIVGSGQEGTPGISPPDSRNR
jgi:hypothetical protein